MAGTNRKILQPCARAVFQNSPPVEKLRLSGYMDAFGSNFSSVRLLQNLAVDMIKIDLHSFYTQPDNPRGDIILSTIIELASKLDVKVIIESVETKELAEKMFKMGCYNMQGFYYSRPLTSDDYIEFLSHHT